MEIQREIYVIIGDDYLEELDTRLRSYGITRKALADAIGKHPSHISRMFNKRVQPNMNTVKQIERAVVDLRVAKKRQQADAEMR